MVWGQLIVIKRGYWFVGRGAALFVPSSPETLFPKSILKINKKLQFYEYRKNRKNIILIICIRE